jgi:hypothetical protein
MTGPVHSSDLLKRLIDEAPRETVDLDWLLGHLKKRAFGVLLLILAIAILVPGLGIVSSIAIAFPAVEMMLGRDRPALPLFLTKRSFASQRFINWAKRALPVLRAVERISRSRWHTPRETTKRAVGLLVLLLAVSGIWPLPLINILPAVTIALLAIAFSRKTDSCSLSLSLSGSCRCWCFVSSPGSRPEPLKTSLMDGCTCIGGSAESRPGPPISSELIPPDRVAM